MVKWTLTNIMGVPDTFVWNIKNSGSFRAIGLRKVMSNEYPELVDTLCRLEGTITNSTKDDFGNLYGEVIMNIFDVATDRPIAKVSMQASKGKAGWTINNFSVNKTGNSLTNLQQTEERFESTTLSVDDVIVIGTRLDKSLAGERTAVGLLDSESVELLGTAFDTVDGIELTQGETNKFRAREAQFGETSYERLGNSNVSYKANLSNGEAITVMDSHHTQNGNSSQYAKFRTVESQGWLTSTHIPQNVGKSDLVFSTIAQGVDSKSTPCAFVTHTVPSLGSDSNDIPSPVTLSANTEVSNNAALFALKNLNISWATVDQLIEK